MSTQTPMTSQEKSVILDRYLELKHEGKLDEAEEVFKTFPITPYFAKALKEAFGADMLIASGYNFSEAEAEYGKDWLVR